MYAPCSLCGSDWDETFRRPPGRHDRPVCAACDEAEVREDVRWDAGFARMVAEAQFFLEADHEFENLR